LQRFLFWIDSWYMKSRRILQKVNAISRVRLEDNVLDSNLTVRGHIWSGMYGNSHNKPPTGLFMIPSISASSSHIELEADTLMSIFGRFFPNQKQADVRTCPF
jgi:hypothetical protein